MVAHLKIPRITTPEQEFSSREVCQILQKVDFRRFKNKLLLIDTKSRFQALLSILKAIQEELPFLVLTERTDKEDLIKIVSSSKWKFDTVQDNLFPIDDSHFSSEKPNSGNSSDSSIAVKKLNAFLPTSGTSGDAKLLKATLKHFVANAENHRAYSNDYNFKIQNWLILLPLSFTGGLTALVRSLILGYDLFFMESFEPKSTLAWLKSNKIHAASIVPTALYSMFQSEADSQCGADFQRKDGIKFPPNFKYLLIGGSGMSEESCNNLQQKIIGHHPIRFSYGLTETLGQIAISGPKNSLAKRMDELQVLPNVELKIDTNNLLFVKGMTCLSEDILGNNILDNEGWLATGDFASYSDSKLKILGREKDVIISGGKNIQPLQVEARLAGILPELQFVALGLPDEKWGERLVVAIYTQNQISHSDLELLVSKIKSELSEELKPKEVYVCSKLPRTSSGKFRRQELAKKINIGHYVIKKLSL